MVALNVGSIVLRVFNHVPEIPTAISGTPMQSFCEEAALDVTNFTGDTIDLTNIPTKYQSVLIHATAAMTLGYIAGVGVDFSYALGEFSADKSDSSSQAQLIKMHLDLANIGLHRVGRKIDWFKANG